MGGDSGSVWLRESNNRAIGLHFAGETDPMPASENAICSPIGPIASELKFSFSPVLCPVLPVPPIYDICRRYPWICRQIIRYPFPRLGFQDAAGDGMGDDEARMMDELRQYLGNSSDGECDCGCSCNSGGGNDRVMKAILAAMLSNKH